MMADEAPAVNASAAEDAGTNKIYTCKEGYQYYQTLSTLDKGSTWINVPGTKRYLTGKPGSWGGYKGVAHGPHGEEGPLSDRTILAIKGIAREETRCFTSKEKVMPLPKYSLWLEEVELPSLEAWGPDAPPPPTMPASTLRFIVARGMVFSMVVTIIITCEIMIRS